MKCLPVGSLFVSVLGVLTGLSHTVYVLLHVGFHIYLQLSVSCSLVIPPSLPPPEKRNEQFYLVPRFHNVEYSLQMRNNLVILQSALHHRAEHVKHYSHPVSIQRVLAGSMPRALELPPTVALVRETNTLNRTYSPNNLPK